MPWQEMTKMSQKHELVSLAQYDGVNKRDLFRRYNVSHTTGYRLINRFEAEGEDGLRERSRRPHNSPNRTPPQMEEAVLAVRDEHPAWGGRTIRRRLQDLGHDPVPSASTITAILSRNGRLRSARPDTRDWTRFERPLPNDLWQMDFKGHFPTAEGRCHPMTVIDDHSRFALGLNACSNERAETVRQHLTAIFRAYGLPARMLMDNGAPWGTDAAHAHTHLTVWLMRLGVAVSHGRPYHPQTQGKCERFHRTLKAELLQGRHFADIAACQRAFDRWRHTYNAERPHQALDLDTPLSRYTPSVRNFPETLPAVEYADCDLVRKVMDGGWVSFKGREFRVGKAFRGQYVALRPTRTDGVWGVWFMTYLIAQVDLRGPEPLLCKPDKV